MKVYLIRCDNISSYWDGRVFYVCTSKEVADAKLIETKDDYIKTFCTERILLEKLHEYNITNPGPKFTWGLIYYNGDDAAWNKACDARREAEDKWREEVFEPYMKNVYDPTVKALEDQLKKEYTITENDRESMWHMLDRFYIEEMEVTE